MRVVIWWNNVVAVSFINYHIIFIFCVEQREKRIVLLICEKYVSSLHIKMILRCNSFFMFSQKRLEELIKIILLSAPDLKS